MNRKNKPTSHLKYALVARPLETSINNCYTGAGCLSLVVKVLFPHPPINQWRGGLGALIKGDRHRWKSQKGYKKGCEGRSRPPFYSPFPPFCCGVHRISFRERGAINNRTNRKGSFFSFAKKGNPPKTMKFFMVQALLVAFVFSHTTFANLGAGLGLQLGGDGGSSSSSSRKVSPSHSQIF